MRRAAPLQLVCIDADAMPLFFGGVDTTRNQLGLAMQTFLGEAWRRLAEEPELAEAAVEEVMRLNPTVTWVTREAIEDLEFHGLEIARGTTIHFVARMDMGEALALLALRLRDPRVDGEVKSLPRSGNTGPIELPIAFRSK